VDIRNHPIWTQTTPYKTKIPGFKKPLHLLRLNLARQYAKLFPREAFIGITGSVGKTTCTAACLEVMLQKYPTIATKPSLDPILNIPITILKLRPNIKRAIFEMGVEYSGEMDFYLSLIRPKTAIITRIYFAHSEFLGSVDEIIEEKGKLIEQLPDDGVAILNFDDPNSKKLAAKTKAEIIYYGTDSKNCTVWAGNVKIENFRTTFELNYGVERVKVEYQLLGEHQIYPALAAAALGLSQGIPLVRIKKGLEKVEPSDHRLQAIAGFNGSIILDDSYNSSPAAALAAIDTLLEVPARRRILVLGEMKELGAFSEKLHRELGRKIYREKIDYVFLGTGDTKFIVDELESLGFLTDRLEADLQNSQIVSRLLKVLGKGDVCLIKGSRGVRLDEVVKRISKKA
jgi:UDP-N-acetylmuramoyl-tripeptide--D-alanyl-D-alanine ligase